MMDRFDHLRKEIARRQRVGIEAFRQCVPAVSRLEEAAECDLSWLEAVCVLLVAPSNAVPVVVHAKDTVDAPLLVLPEGLEDENVLAHELGHVVQALVAPCVDLTDGLHEEWAEWFREHLLGDRDPLAERRAFDVIWDGCEDYGQVLEVIASIRRMPE